MTIMKAALIAGLILGFSLLEGCKSNIADPLPPGPAWIVYTQSNAPLTANHINAITVDSDGKIWFATDTGATSFDAHSTSWARIKDSLKSPAGSSRVNCITEAQDKSIWFGLLGGGAVRFNRFSATGTVWRRYDPNSELNFLSFVVSSAAADNSNATPLGEVWFGTPSGINRYHQVNVDDGTWTMVLSGTTGLTTDRIASAARNPIDGHIWFGGEVGGASEVYFDTDFRWAHYAFPVHQASVNGIAFDVAGNVWFAKDIGVSVLNVISGSWQHYTRDSAGTKLPSNLVHAVVTDFYSIRWFGTDSGLVRMSDSTWTRFTKSNSPLPDNDVTAVKYDLRGNLWIGTAKGVAVFKEGGTTF